MTFYNFENMSLKAANEILNAHADSVVRFLDMPEGGERTALHKQLYAVLYGPAMVVGEYFAGEDNMDKGHDLLNQILDGASKYMPSKRSLSGFFGDCLKRRKIDAVRQKNPSSQTLERRIHHSPFANQQPQQPLSGIGGCYRRKNPNESHCKLHFKSRRQDI